MIMRCTSNTVAILYPGEMGASLGVALRTRGLRVVTCLRGRSRQTSRRCREAGIHVLESMDDVVRQAKVVVSLVPPAAARQVAEAYFNRVEVAPVGAVYVEANSIGPDLAVELATEARQCGVGYVDAAINGLAANLTSSSTLYLSGAQAGEISVLFGDGIRVDVLGEEPGRASAMKMLLGGISKGTCALFIELALLAHRHGMLKEFDGAVRRIYPGLWALVERMVPTYRRHAARRATEMAELRRTVLGGGLQTDLIDAIVLIHEALCELGPGMASEEGAVAVESLICDLVRQEILTTARSVEKTTVVPILKE